MSSPLDLRPRYNLAPGQRAAVIRTGADGRALSMLRWGLIPSWAKSPNIGYKTINARAETVRSKPAFRAAFRARRCAVPADGFYEWAPRGARKQPYLVTCSDAPLMLFAGLWERWRVPDGYERTASIGASRAGDALETFTILTTAANEAMARVHHRMPVLLDTDALTPWLAGEDVELGPCPSDILTIRAVSTRVNNARNDGPECIETVVGT
ncbi:SOS response-associated peptidase [Candidatus Rariloculus sp.]|uniref:SOS response-associated peptidase n=1 Tax=Candidatus Rariloculus sp. TaxID=3101265 RepID=UPI003D0DA2B8